MRPQSAGQQRPLTHAALEQLRRSSPWDGRVPGKTSLPHQGIVDACKVGVRQCDVMAELYKITIGGTREIGGTFPCKPPNAMVGDICSAPHLSWSDRPLRRGEIFYIEQAGVRHRYPAPLSRCIHLGRPPQKMLDTTAVIVEGLEAALAAVRPGTTLHAVEDAWRRVIAKHGIVKDSRSASAFRQPGASSPARSARAITPCSSPG